jgi:hypothetical protein
VGADGNRILTPEVARFAPREARPSTRQPRIEIRIRTEHKSTKSQETIFASQNSEVLCLCVFVELIPRSWRGRYTRASIRFSRRARCSKFERADFGQGAAQIDRDGRPCFGGGGCCGGGSGLDFFRRGLGFLFNFSLVVQKSCGNADSLAESFCRAQVARSDCVR